MVKSHEVTDNDTRQTSQFCFMVDHTSSRTALVIGQMDSSLILDTGLIISTSAKAGAF